MARVDPLEPVHAYHDRSKHRPDRLARSLGYLDWATQPAPFRSYAPAERIPLLPALPRATVGPRATWDALGHLPPPAPLTLASLSDLFRHALGLSAWKQFRETRWALRVNPSSGNLHPTEAYLVAGPLDGACESPAVYHYAPDDHAFERRAVFAAEAWEASGEDSRETCFIVLSSIHWREAWKYGERAFRYCQHDLGHAMAALAIAAAGLGWHVELMPEWASGPVGQLAGLDRDDERGAAEPEEPGCLLRVGRQRRGVLARGDSQRFAAAVAAGQWFGRPSQLSPERIDWPAVDDVAEATRAGVQGATTTDPGGWAVIDARLSHDRGVDLRGLVLQRRSAQAFDPTGRVPLMEFERLLARTLHTEMAPWSSAWWSPRVHLAVFVHQVTGLDAGLYLLPRDSSAIERLERACAREFAWKPAGLRVPLLALASGDARVMARRLSCDQDIAGDSAFTLGMIAEFDRSLEEFGPTFYRHLFWEAGLIGQALYLEAEAAGLRGTGIGCYYDDAVHEALGVDTKAVQSLYHFTVGVPKEDQRLRTEPGYSGQ